MTDEEALKVLTYLRSAYPRQELRKDTVAVYCDAIRALDYADAYKAARKHVAVSAWWPAIAELLGLVAQEQVACEPAEQAWSTVTRAISAWGRYRPWKFANPITQMAVDSIGKDEICNSENLGIERAHFMRIYASYRDTELAAARAAPMLGEKYEPRLSGRTGSKGIAEVLKLVAEKAAKEPE